MKPLEFYRTQAWKYCSRYVLLFYSTDGLLAKCCTCGKIIQINTKKAHCGHLIKITDSWATAFEFTNLGPQCNECNRYQGGRPDIMKDWLILKHGLAEINKLYIKKYNYCKISKYHLEYFEGYYKALFDELVKEKGNPWNKRNSSIRSY